jgi:hypothetical protein
MDSLKSAIGMEVDASPPVPPGRDGATGGAATAAAAAATTGAAAGKPAGSGSSEGMLSGLTKSVKKVFGADDDAPVPGPSAKPGAQPATGAKKRDKDQVARPRPGAAQETVGRPRPRAKEEQVARPDMPEDENVAAPRAKSAKPKGPPPAASSESITDQVTSGVKRVLGVDGDAAPVAPPVPR